ncbi:MAG: signal recognition particle protein [Dialister sp.]|uniref:signal recognition particle protein n=1 Tax=Dialister sp. i34-0019-2H8 TaxID=3141190 RepID=UPI000EC34598|nr:signal recognition particle protein [Dialister sp.]MDD6958870.1 signal recognition particle protein [Dialister sp.]MDD7072835.1 signal recognition particle protein [Dialister sp.]MDD7325227.1 signal recognition particle protein [Dialister sp.]MDD7666004.1 signal recognition particle protein [Dialister sp.]
MPFENLGDKLQSAFKDLRGKGKLSESDIDGALREVRRALLEADVNFKVAKDFIAHVREKAMGEEVFGSLKPDQTVIKIVKDELTELLGGTQSKITLSSSGMTIIMLVGLQGAGKTTTAGKLALMFKKKGHRPMMAACDVYRPAAIKQLEVLGEQTDVPVYRMPPNVDPVHIAQYAIDTAKAYNRDVVILDTAGRLTIDEKLMAELRNIKAEVHPHEILLVLDSMTGQDAVNTAKAFDENLGIDGTILTKMDGDARGGAALSIKTVTGKPIKMIGVSEKLDGGLEDFYPDRMAGRILDLGDLATLIETAQRNMDEESMKDAAAKVRKGEFTLDDFLNQLKQVRKLGSFQSILGMLPGMGKFKDQLKDIDLDGKEVKHIEAIILSMTPQERANVKILNGSRRKRIAQGAGVKIQDVNRMMKQFADMQKTMKKMKGMNPKKLNPSKLGGLGGLSGMFRK